MRQARSADGWGTWSTGASGGGLPWDTRGTGLAGRHSVAQRQEEPDERDQQAAGNEEPQPAGAPAGIFARRGITHATWFLSLRHRVSAYLYMTLGVRKGDQPIRNGRVSTQPRIGCRRNSAGITSASHRRQRRIAAAA